MTHIEIVSTGTYVCVVPYIVGQNEIQVKMKFLCLSALIIHGS